MIRCSCLLYTSSVYKSYDDLPLFLNARMVAQVLGVSISTAYELLNDPGFPTLRVGSRMVVPKEKFIQWAEGQSGGCLLYTSYHKLVRDRIPEIIEADGKICVCETLADEDYMHLLDQKLNEELAEYQESKSLEELADLLEVMQAVVRARGWTLEDLERVRADKAAKRGGFEKKILLKEVQEDC